MSINAVTHLNFRGQAREALEFYRSVFGGELTVATYGDFGMPSGSPDALKVVFGQLVADNGFRVMAYDIPGQDGPAPLLVTDTRREHGTTITDAPFFLSVRGDSVSEVGALFGLLAVGGVVVEAFGPAPWAPGFGMLTDRFGVTWILDVPAAR